MLTEINQRLVTLQERIRLREKLARQTAAARDRLAQEQARLAELTAELDKEGRDVDRLTRPSLAALVAAISGDKDIRLKQERQELLQARLRLDQCQAALAALEAELAELERQAADLGDPAADLAAALKQKEAALLAADLPEAADLGRLIDDLARLRAAAREVDEALAAGRVLQDELAALVKLLESAEGWGTFDLIGGGLVATLVKHGKLDQARQQAAQVQQKLDRFQRELADLGQTGQMVVELSSFERFADYIFDNVFTDWIVQSRIRESLDRTRQAADRVKALVADLARRRAQLRDQAAAAEATWRDRVAAA